MKRSQHISSLIYGITRCRTSGFNCTPKITSVNKTSVCYKSDASDVSTEEVKIYPNEEEKDYIEEDIVTKIRSKFKLQPADLRRLNREPPDLTEEEKTVLDLKSYRKLYGERGEAPGINVAALWPSKSELTLMKEYEEVAYPHTVQQMIELEKRRKQEEEEEIRIKQEKMLENMKKLNDWKASIREKMAKQEAIAMEKLNAKKKQIEDVRRMLGYNIRTSDPKFVETVTMIEEEEKIRLKKERKLRKKQKELEKLMAIAEGQAQQQGQSIIEGQPLPPTETVPPKNAKDS